MKRRKGLFGIELEAKTKRRLNSWRCAVYRVVKEVNADVAALINEIKVHEKLEFLFCTCLLRYLVIFSHLNFFFFVIENLGHRVLYYAINHKRDDRC